MVRHLDAHHIIIKIKYYGKCHVDLIVVGTPVEITDIEDVRCRQV